MKKYIFLIFTLFLFLFSLGCGKKQLDTPILTISEDTVTWAKIENAIKYEISLNGTLSYIEIDVTNKKLNDGDSIKIRSIGDGKKYTDSNWSNTVTYNIDEFTVLETDKNVKKHTFPSYDRTTPTKPSTDKYSYEFTGWDKDLNLVTEDITYNAVFKETINKYEVTWMSENNILKTELVEYGVIPTYNETPVKESTDKYSYNFTGWDKTLSPVTCDTIYNAQYKETINQYTITFYNEDGISILEEVTVGYGENVIYPQNNPVKNASESHTYTFDKWVTTKNGIIEDDLSNVIKDRNVYASFKSEIRKVTVYILSNNSYGTISTNVLNDVDYGTEIKVVNNKLYIGNSVIEANAIDSNDQFSYEFVKWEADSKVTHNTNIMANFNRSVNKYTITWMQDDIVLATEEVEYGQTPKYKGEIPTKPTLNEIDYTFNGWSPYVSNVTGNAVYHAQFTESIHKYQIKFYDEDGITLLNSIALVYGEKAIYNNALPTKLSTPQYDFTFEKWVTEINGSTEANLDFITKDINVYAKYTFETRKYIVKFYDYDGTILKEETVEYGMSALAPTVRERESYRFIGWDKECNYINDNLSIYAKYIMQVTVKFVDYNNSIISLQIIDYGQNAILPDEPQRNNYQFTSWSASNNNIKEDVVIKAQYKKLHNINFYDYYGNLLINTSIIDGGNLEDPFNDLEDNLTIEGYTFECWNTNLNNVNSNLDIYPLYNINKYKVTYIYPDSEILSFEVVDYGNNPIIPKYPSYYFNWKTITNYSFTGFSIDKDTNIYLIYKTEMSIPTIAIEHIKGDIQSYLKFSLTTPSSYYIYGLNFEFDYKLLSILSVTTYDQLGKEQYHYNNKENVFNYILTSTNGTKLYDETLFSTLFLTMEIYINNNITINSDTINFLSDELILLYSTCENQDVDSLIEVKPIIIFK